MRIWIDTDLGTDVDDALTLGYALRHPRFELVGVSTVFGDVALRTRMTRALLDRAGADVPIVTGLGAPLTPGRDGLMFGHEGLGLLEDAAPVLRTKSDPDPDGTVRALAGAIEDARPDVLLAIGPLTNVGALAREGSALPRLAIMGGKIQDVMLPGMNPEIPEWNWYCDPEAVRLMLEAPLPEPARVVPFEVTFRTALAGGDVERLAEGDALARALSALSVEWLRAQRERLGRAEPRVALHDPLTAATLVVPDLCPFALQRIRIDDRGGSEIVGGEPNVLAATDVDTERLRAHLMETWLQS